MADFKIVCGINPKEETIINLDMIVEISLAVDNTISFVRMVDKWGVARTFETDLKELDDVLKCFQFSFSKVVFKKEALDFNIEVRRIGEISKLRSRTCD